MLSAWRALRRRPGFAVLAIVPLAIGIGFTTAIFSIASALLIRPLPFPDGDRLMFLQSTQAAGTIHEFNVAAPDFADWQRENRSFTSMGASQPSSFNMAGAGPAQRVGGGRVTASLFATLGVRARLGRVIAEEDERTNAPVVLLSEEFWKTQFGGSPEALGRAVSLDGRSYSVVGVLPEGFRFGPKADVFIPLVPRGQELVRNTRGLVVVGRLRPGVTRARAEADIRAISAALARTYREDVGWGASVRPLRDILVENVRSAVWILVAASGFLLLVACVNVSNLLLIRAVDRRPEAALRAALGAGRGRILRGFLAEGLLLAAAGGALGIALAWAGLKPLLAVCPVELSTVGPVGIDARVLAFAAAISALCALFFGSAAGWEGSRTRIASILNDAGRSASGGKGSRRIQAALVASEIGVVFLLVTGSAVAYLAFRGLMEVSPGFETRGALMVPIAVSDTRYPELAQREALVERLRARVAAIPGVSGVATTNKLPLDDRYMLTSFLAEGRPGPPDDAGWDAHFRRVSPTYFRIMGTPLVEGREFTDDDRDGHPLVAIVSRELARRQWPGQSALGKRVQRLGVSRPWITVVGVAADVRDFSLAADSPPTMYVPYAQGKAGLPDLAVVVRTAMEPSALARPLREALAAIDPDLPSGAPQPLSVLVTNSLKRQRFQMLLMGLLAAAGTILAGVGIFGLTAYTVSQQSRELSIRLALGATASGVVRLVVGRGVRLAALGLTGGLIAVFFARGLLAGMLPGAPSPGPYLVAGLGVSFGAVCVLASWLAARRASRISPTFATSAR